MGILLLEKSANKEKQKKNQIIEQNSLENQLKRRTVMEKKAYETLDDRVEENLKRFSTMSMKKSIVYFRKIKNLREI